MEFEIKDILLNETIRTEPKMIVRFYTSQPFQEITNPEITLGDYSGFITEIHSKSITITLLDYTTYNTVTCQYLGDSLLNSIETLNILPVETDMPDLNQDFYSFNELPWTTLCRLMSYIPSDYYWTCNEDNIRIFQAPTEFTEYYGVRMTTASYMNRFNSDNLILESDYNPSYHSICSIPINKLAAEQGMFSKDMITNYMNNYLNRGNVYKDNAQISTELQYAVGQGITINDKNYMVISRTTIMDKDFHMTSSQYNLIGV